MISSFNSKKPVIDKTAFVHESASIIGAVSLAEHSSVWCFASIRADLDSIIIGKNSNVQDNCSMHTDKGFPVVVGDNVTIGHNAVVHGCTIGNNTLIGISAVILNGAKIGNNCIIGAGAVVTENTEIQDNSLVLGVPGRVVKSISAEQKELIENDAKQYMLLKNHYMKMKKK